MMLLPQTTEYALRATLELAARHPRPVSVATLAAAVGAPENYLSKTLNHLARAGILASSRGPSGGFRLVDAPERITLERIVFVFTPRQPARCLLGHGVCGTNPECVVHARWAPIAASIDDYFRSTTLADLASPSAGDAFPFQQTVRSL